MGWISVSNLMNQLRRKRIDPRRVIVFLPDPEASSQPQHHSNPENSVAFDPEEELDEFGED